jgi:hypothetical protein
MNKIISLLTKPRKAVLMAQVAEARDIRAKAFSLEVLTNRFVE